MFLRASNRNVIINGRNHLQIQSFTNEGPRVYGIWLCESKFLCRLPVNILNQYFR